MDELEEFISILNAECDVLKKNRLMPKSEDEPWRYYSYPLDDEHEFEHLRSIIEAGKYTVQAEQCVEAGDELGACHTLIKAQQSLLKSLSVMGKSKAKKLGNAKGGETKGESIHYEIFCIADDLLAAGHNKRGLAAKIAKKLNEKGIEKNENRINNILKNFISDLT